MSAFLQHKYSTPYSKLFKMNVILFQLSLSNNALYIFFCLNIANINGMLSMHRVFIVWPAFFLDGVKFYC